MSDDDHLHSIIADYGDACAEMQAEINRLRAELAAKAKRFDDAVEAIDLKDKELIQERGVARDLRKRVGELEAQLETSCSECISLEAANACAEQAKAQLAEAKAAHRRDNDGAKVAWDIQATALEAANARIAELENKNSYNLQIVREATARIAELEADKVRFQQQLEDFRTDARDECARAERAEAERDAKGAALSLALAYLFKYEPGDSRAVSDEFVAMAQIDCGIVSEAGMEIIRKARALAPSPAGLEERHEMTSIGDKEPDADPDPAREPPRRYP